ncbi:hypothetical protein BOW53_16880 [Solemya pervernicosa gill symbiont]|uniref:Uncharacterized protein n=1 Tax=Solemya pervernicosa gill symbiont TaxID=642797 RepID=A0A1T2KYN6_9GAMM|nr:hypothetical protein BOW53_16880 [Solemya pervernicosa gill symbiont]
MDDLNEDSLWHGLELANQNAHTLLTVAEDASRRHAFGVAVALSILSAEEAAKSLGLATRALSHQPD